MMKMKDVEATICARGNRVGVPLSLFAATVCLMSYWIPKKRKVSVA